MVWNVREFFGLGSARSRSNIVDASTRARLAKEWAAVEQKRRAADILWAAGEFPEAGGLLNAALALAVASIDRWAAPQDTTELGSNQSAGGDAPLQDHDGETLNVQAPLASMPSKDPVAFAAVEQVRARVVSLPLRTSKQFRTLMRQVRLLERVMRPVARGPAFIRWTRFRRFGAVGMVLLGLASFVGYRVHVADAPWLVRYYTNLSLNGTPVRDVAHAVDFDWGTGAPAGVPPDLFSARFDTCLRLARPQIVRISIGSDDGSRVLLDSEEVVSNWARHVVVWKHGRRELDAGVHSLRVEYYEDHHAASVKLWVRGEDGEFPGELFRPSAPDEGCGAGAQ